MAAIYATPRKLLSSVSCNAQYVKEIWKELKDYGICLKLNNFTLTELKIWLLDWITEAWAVHSMIVAVAIWHAWENRNCSPNGQALPHPLRVVRENQGLY